MLTRSVLVAVAGLALAACTVVTNGGQKKEAAAPADDSCVQSISRDIAILGGAPDYIVEARSFEGAKPASAEAVAVAKANPCARATVVLTFRRKDDGAFVHGYATSMNRMDLIEGHAGPPFDGARLRDFLDGWASAVVATTEAASPLSETVTSSLNASRFAAMKAAKKPMICFETSVHETACFVVSPDNVYEFEPFYLESHA